MDVRPLRGLILGLVLRRCSSADLDAGCIRPGLYRDLPGTPLILQMVFAYDALPISDQAERDRPRAWRWRPTNAFMLKCCGRCSSRPRTALRGRRLDDAALLMRRIIAPQAIRTMIPRWQRNRQRVEKFVLASVISVQADAAKHAVGSSTFDSFRSSSPPV